MPDGDKFEGSLRGKGWRKAYRQACDGASSSMLRDTLLSAAAAALRGPLFCNSLPKIRDAVYHALRERARSGELNFGNQKSADPYRMLSDLVDDIAREDANSIATRLAGRAGQPVYLELERVCDSVTTDRIQERLGEKFVQNVIKHQFLAPVRDGIVLKNSRTREDQIAWEEDLLSHLAKPLRNIGGQLFRTDRKVTVRAPRRTTPQRKMTIEELQQGIAVQETQND